MGFIQNFTTLIRDTLNLNEHIDTETAERSIRNNIEFKGPNAWILAVAVIIASVGLNVNSIPVVIGAMLISPLMGPIFGLGLGLGVSDIQLMKSSGKNLLIMVSISLAVAFIYFIITPLSLSNPTELLARTSPTFYDVLIALFGGFAGILEQCRKDKGTVFSGVAIATALMPPLCTAGYGLACGEFSYFLGALYLFVINCTFIMLATYAGVKYFRFRPTEYQDETIGKRTKRLTTALIIIFIIPSIWSAVLLIQQNNFEVNATSFAEHRSTYGKSILYDYKIDHNDNTSLTLFFTGEALSERDKDELYSVAAEYDINKEQIQIRDYALEDKSDMNAFKDIYEKKESIISAKEQEIVLLKNELEKIKSNELEYDKISKEIFSIKSSVSGISITKGHIYNRDSTSRRDVISVVVSSLDSIDTGELEELREWLKVRMDTEVIEIRYHQNITE
ncbi:MAG: TIGR00341 family protein [Bacteroidales bacterium]|nr:TIGR00341 family protein [Bacteroidales bacterium]